MKFLILFPILLFASETSEKRIKTYMLIKKACKVKSIIKTSSVYKCGNIVFHYDDFKTLSVFIGKDLYHQEYHDQYSLKESHSMKIKKELDRIYSKEKTVEEKVNSFLKE